MKKQWAPSYELQITVAKQLSHGTQTAQQLVDVLGLPQHQIQRSLQVLCSAGCIRMYKKPVPAKGFIGVYTLVHLPARTSPEEEEPIFIPPKAKVNDALSKVWPISVTLPNGKGRIVRR